MMWLSKLRQMKEESGKTIAEISKVSGIPEGTLEKLFAGVTKDPRLETIKTVVHTLGYTLDDLEDEKKEARIDNRSEPQVSTEALASLLEQAGLLKPGADLSDADLSFLSSIVSIISAWFER